MNRTFGQLLNSIDNKLMNDMKDGVWDKVFTDIKTKVLQESVQKNVYNVYPNPKQYKRTNLLKYSWSYELKEYGKKIAIFNTRTDLNKWIPEIVETGKGYDFPQYPYDYNQERPFIKYANLELVKYKDKYITDVIKHELKRKGFRFR